MVSKLPGESRPLNDVDINKIRNYSSRALDLGVVDAFYISDATTKPIAYLELIPKFALPYKIRTDGVDINLQSISKLPPSGPRVVIANFLYRHWFTAFTDKGQTLSIHADNLGRIAVEVPTLTTKLSIRYSPPWRYGFYLSLILLLTAFLLEMVKRYRNHSF
jgi:hypothetical protein